MIDLHSHTNASDGQHPPRELVALARQAGVTTLAVTDHDTVAGLAEAIAESHENGGPEVIPGIEVSTEVNGVDIHVLGHFLRFDDPALLRYTAQQGGERRRRMERMVAKMNALGFPVTMARVEAIAQSENFCRPHLARALVELGYVKDTQDAFSRYIGDDGPGFVSQARLSAKQAIAVIHGAGGTATLAHPGVDKIDRYQLTVLKQAGLDGLEVFHADHNPSVREKYLKIARELDLVPTAGSDFHGEAVAPGRHLGDAALEPALFEALRARSRKHL